MDYLLSATNMVKYKNRCQYFYIYFVLIARGFFINKFKNIFNTSLTQILKDNKEYNYKTTYKMFENKKNWIINKLIERIYGYTKPWITFFGSSNYIIKHLYIK